MRDVGGREVGVVALIGAGSGTRVEGRFSGLAAQGYHGFHVHQNPVCDAEAPDGPFTTAGGHYNPGSTTHGEHAGDLPPLLFEKNGVDEVSVVTGRFTLEQLRQKGAALVVHEQADNLAHIPDRYQSNDAPSPGPDEKTRDAGDGGDRIACGVIPKG
ncbi:superoxide dismutase family protein [Frankia nepalensis]|nr:superoxide dismutase family protein [Frankia nepalensis]